MNTFSSSWLGFLTFLALIATAVWGCAPKPAANDPSSTAAETDANQMAACKAVIRLSANKPPLVEVSGLPPEELQTLAKSERTPEQWHSLFAVFVGKSREQSRQPIWGSYRVDKDRLLFEPRFPLAPGVVYRGVLHPDRLPGHTASERPVETILQIPKPRVIPTTTVAQVYPSADELPENHLRFYLHFSAPMSQGDAYEHIHLLRPDGKADKHAFVELPQELWDRDGKRFTLLLDPGRIKRGLKPREEFGPILLAGGKYTLVIDSDWRDAKGNPLRDGYRKTFRALPPDDTLPGPETWEFEAPDEGGTKAPYILTSRKPLDHALMLRMLWIIDSKGQRVPGKVEVAQNETVWRFTPDMPWKSGSYSLVADKRLEDLAGNSIARPFEVDMLRPIENESKTETVRLSFLVP